jgi:hypothetical protein
MDELEISGRRYISSARAAKEHKYHSDYIGQLVRGGRVAGQKVGRAWYVDAESLKDYLKKEATPTGPKAAAVKAAEPTFAKAAPRVEAVEVEEEYAKEELKSEPEVEMFKGKFARRPHVIAAIDGVAKKPSKEKVSKPVFEEVKEVEEVREAEEETEPIDEVVINVPEAPREVFALEEEETFIPVKVEQAPRIEKPQDSFYKISRSGLTYVGARTKPQSEMRPPARIKLMPEEALAQPRATSSVRKAILLSMVIVAGIISLSGGALLSYYLHSNTTVDAGGQVSGVVLSQ